MIESAYVKNELIENVLIVRLRTDQLTERETSPVVEDIAKDAPASGWKVAIDCSGVRFIASAGIGAMVTICRQCKEKNGQFAVFNASPEIAELIQIMKLHKLFKVAPDEAKAIKAVR
ncbi:MAG: anti-sigma factor antagonist [Phycisphaerales bacterium]|nr:MAG: anti-sigma factor antagonist [Phycisphaerales bacterium]